MPTHAPQHSDYCIPGSQTNLVPIKGFVHEVLRRSRASGSVLQTALRYLEAIREKIPELVEKEKKGELESKENPIYQPRLSKVTLRRRNGHSFSTPPARNSSPNLKGAGLR
jgi:hypothetical protein